VKERPILFKGEMVRAIIESRKKQTRRILKDKKDVAILGEGCGVLWDEQACPYGEVGDRLWVRESFRTETNYYDDLKPSQLSGDEGILYCADGDYSHNKTVGRYRPPMFMPRGLSRITLEITDIRVERLNDISESDAIAEGIIGVCEDGLWNDPCDKFADLWESINGAGSWDLNPWVWVVEFKKI